MSGVMSSVITRIGQPIYQYRAKETSINLYKEREYRRKKQRKKRECYWRRVKFQVKFWKKNKKDVTLRYLNYNFTS